MIQHGNHDGIRMILGALMLGAFFSTAFAGVASAAEPATASVEATPAAAGKASGSKRAERSYGYSVRTYKTPEVGLTDANGASVDLSSAIDSADTVVVGFIFTTCQGVCPVITATMANATRELDKDGRDYKVLLVSLDPEYDTPARLNEYAKRFRTGERISFLTGSRDDIFEVLRRFDSLYLGGRKMSHQPVTLIRNRGDHAWVRLDGLVDARSLVSEIRKVQTGGEPIAAVTP